MLINMTGALVTLAIFLWKGPDRIINLSLTQSPVLAGAGFILTGLSGVLAGLTLWLHRIKLLRILGAITLLTAAAIWALIGYMAYWKHMIPPS